MLTEIDKNHQGIDSNKENKALAVDLQDVHVCFRAYDQRPGTLKEHILKFIKSGKFRYFSTFEALSEINLNIYKGEIFGILGSNGAGKSTLLQVISKVLKPTLGAVSVNGSLDSLIKLGAGFDSELNAIENIYLSGSLRRWSKSYIEKRVPEIIKFAELENFVHMPIKYYSSGMNARLGFAVAIDADPDILLVDEVIAVGDERFQAKCNEVINQIYSSGKTVIMVSHNLDFLKKRCTRIGVLQKGRFVFIGDPQQALDYYRSDNYQLALSS